MKRFFTLATVLICLASTSCDDSEEFRFEPVTINGMELPSEIRAYIIDEGLVYSTNEGDIYQTLFVIGDYEYVFDEDGNIDNLKVGDLEFGLVLHVRTINQKFQPGSYPIEPTNDCNYIQRTENIPSGLHIRWDNTNNDDYDHWDNYFHGKSGTIQIARKGNTYTLSFDGLLFDMNDPIELEEPEDGSCLYTGFNTVEITGKHRSKFTFISEEVWRTYNYP